MTAKRKWRVVSAWVVVNPTSAPGARTLCQGRSCPLPGNVIPEGETVCALVDESMALNAPHDPEGRRYACSSCAAKAVGTTAPVREEHRT